MLSASTASTGRAQSAPVPRLGRGIVAGAAVIGGGLLIVGSLLPWLTFYAGLDTLRGIDGTNGRVLTGAGLLAILLAVAYAWRPNAALRWALGGLGFAASGFGAWVASQVLGSYQQLQGDSFVVAGMGAGAFVALAGGLILLGTLLVPQRDVDAGAVAAAPVRPLPSDARDVLLAGVVSFLLGAAMIHFAVVGSHLQESTLYAVFFVVAAVAQVGAALLVMWRPSRQLLLTVAAANAVVIVVWAISRTVGLPFGPTPGVAETVSLPDVLATVAEAAIVGLGLAMVRVEGPRLVVRRWTARLGVAMAASAAVVLTVVAVVAVQAGGG